ncbi:hypothetical protein DVH24_030013 [Malus domestica]|uniref:F-box associated beta-propeller type 1 domain-containing protein n=1 Tax=Malus domestica TaxID=3750 RepID=A0A498HZ81_MALDO|nr:hypothetical protein DVH24_030013 [Malus domestica]
MKILLSLLDPCKDNNSDVYYLQDLLNVPSTGVAVGFGYDKKSKDCKIIMHFEGFWILFHPHTAEVYIVSSNSWTEIKFDMPSIVVWFPSSQMYFKGFYYWFALELDMQTLDEN